jgi:pSer/pThr/pTyr-binding forkhead associated (FHA) protein
MHSAAAGLGPDPLDGADPRLRVVEGSALDEGAEYDLRRGATLGRGESADIRLEDPFASAHHARIERQGDVLVIEDLGSTNGTFLNGEQLSGPQPLHPGDRIRIGDHEFSYVQ